MKQLIDVLLRATIWTEPHYPMAVSIRHHTAHLGQRYSGGASLD